MASDDPDEPAAAHHAHFRSEDSRHSLGSDSKEQPCEDPFVRKLRSAIRAELGELIGEDGDMREMVRHEVEAVLSRGERRRTAGPSVISRHSRSLEMGIIVNGLDTPPASSERAPAYEAPATTMKQFTRLVKSATEAEIERRQSSSALKRPTYYQAIADRLNYWWLWLASLQEPERSGWLANAVTGKHFEALVCMVIFLNCGFMVRIADLSIQNPTDERPDWLIWEWLFQGFYTVEMVLKLIVHRQYFFCNVNWKLNVFDMVLVVGGGIGLLANHNYELKGGVLRLARSLKVGKAIRAMRILARLKHLRAFLVCLQGSVTTFFWSMVMLGCVYGIVSLYIMQSISLYLAETGEDLTGEMGDMFPTVARSMLTLFEASMGGEDWSVALRAIWATGWSVCAVYLLFIAFVQLALINIITGIFVESAMNTLSPDSETLAVELIKKEEAHAKELAALCRQVSIDNTGKLTPREFRNGLMKGRMPLLLTLLGLERHHVEEYFKTLSHLGDEEEQGEVDIAEFVDGCMKLKGAASNYDIQMMHAELRAGFMEFKAMHAKLSTTVAEMRKHFLRR